MADIKVDVGSAALRTTTGSQTLSISGFGTPKAIIGWIVAATTDDTPANEAAIAYFVADNAGNCGACGMLSQHNLTSSNTRRWSDAQSTGALYIGSGGTYSTDAIFKIDSDDVVAGPTTDGWVIDVTTAPGSGYRVMYVLFGGGDLSAHVASADMTNLTASGTETITPGFQSDLILFCGPNSQAAAPTQVQASLSFGAYNGTNNYSIASGERDARTIMKSYSYAASTRSLTYLYDDALNAACYAGNITSTQYDVINATGNADYIWHFLALNLGGGSASLSMAAAPSSAASDWVVSGLGFTPQAAFAVGSSATADDTIADGLVFGFGAQGANGGQFVGISSEDALTTTSTQSYWADTWMAARDHAGTKTHDIAPSSSPFESGGWTVDAADIATASTAYRWMLIAFETGVTSVTGTVSESLVVTSGESGIGTLVGTSAESLVVTSTESGQFPAIPGTVSDSVVVTSNESGVLTAAGSVSDSTVVSSSESATGGSEASTSQGGGWAVGQRRKRSRLRAIREDDEVVVAIISRLLH